MDQSCKLHSSLSEIVSLVSFLSTELSGSSGTSACGGPGAKGSWLGCGLGRPVGCSSALGM